MVERANQMTTVVSSLDSITDIQRESFETLCAGIENLNDTLTWGFVEISENLSAIEEATYSVKRSVDRVDVSINQLMEVVSVGFGNLALGLDDIAGSLNRIEDAVSDVNKAWAFTNYRQASKALKVGYITEAVRLLELTINGNSSHDPYDFDPRFHYLLGNCYAGNFGAPPISNIDPVKSLDSFEDAVKYSKMHDDLEPEFVAGCLSAAAWSHYCCGNLEKAEDYYAKAVGISSSFDAEYGLAKSIIARAQFTRSINLIRYCLIRYRNSFLIRAASDPDFIVYKDQIEAIRIELVKGVQEASVAVNGKYARASQMLKKLVGEMSGMGKLAEERHIFQNIENRFQHLFSGAIIMDLTCIDEDVHRLEALEIIKEIDDAQDHIRRKGLELQIETAKDKGERIARMREEVRLKYRAEILEIRDKIEESNKIWRFLSAPFKRLMAIDESRTLYQLDVNMKQEIERIGSGSITYISPNTKNRVNRIISTLGAIKQNVRSIADGSSFEAEVRSKYSDIFYNAANLYARKF